MTIPHRAGVNRKPERQRRGGTDLAFYRRPVCAACCYEVLQTLRWGSMRTITQRELRNESAAILRDVQAGQSIIVTRNGTPVAELRPVSPRRFVSRAAIAEAVQTMPRIDAARFRADLEAGVDPFIDV